MSVHDLCCIGYITQDKIVTTKNTIYMPGGTSFYFAHAYQASRPERLFIGHIPCPHGDERCGKHTERGH